ncbi:MAG TPA: amidohydrolase [Anaerolineae bacterium]
MITNETLRIEADSLKDELVSVRRDLHAHPELGFQEVRTAGIVARRLGELGYEVQTGVGKTGVVALMEGAAPHKEQPPQVLLTRFDMDALPITELTDLPYRSSNEGKMHACGHDAHTSIGLAVAQMMAAHRADWSGVLKLVFQPAEETLGGARAMIADGVLESPRPTRALSGHVDSMKPVGTVYMTDGPMMAAADAFTVVVRGRGAHGAAPQEGADPIVAACQLVSALQTIVSRNVSPLDQAVLTVGYFRGGTAFNIIPDVVELGGTLRSYREEVTLLLRERVKSITEHIARALGVEATVSFIEPYLPAVVNDAAMSEIVRDVAREVVGTDNVFSDYRMMGSEDAAYYLKAVPGAFVWVGAGNVARGISEPHHSPRFRIDEDALPVAAAVMTGSAIKMLNE